MEGAFLSPGCPLPDEYPTNYVDFLCFLRRGKRCSHMTNGNIRWNKELCINEAKKYNSKTQFQKNSGGAYNYASRNKLLEEIYLLMKW